MNFIEAWFTAVADLAEAWLRADWFPGSRAFERWYMEQTQAQLEAFEAVLCSVPGAWQQQLGE